MADGTVGALHFSIDIDGDRELSRRLHGYLGLISDWEPFFHDVVADWKATQAQLFAAEGEFEGAEQWAPLSERYARWKERHYPGRGILQRTGALLAATTDPEVETTPSQMTLTIDNAYAIYHQSSRPRGSHLPRRAFASLTPKQKSRWVRLLRARLWQEM